MKFGDRGDVDEEHIQEGVVALPVPFTSHAHAVIDRVIS